MPESVNTNTDSIVPPSEARQEGETLLRRVHVNPVAVARGLALIKSFAVANGLDEPERSEIACFVREDDLLLVADWDRGHTRTVDDAERPFRFRHSIPLLDRGTGEARWTGAMIRPQDLQEAFRNRVENSDLYGVLSGDEPILMEVFARTDGKGEAVPHRIVVHPDQEGRLETRDVFALRGVNISDFDDVEPQTAVKGLPALDPNALFDMAGMASPAVGILLQPWQYIEKSGSHTTLNDRAYLVAVGRQGVSVAQLDEGIQVISEADSEQTTLLESGEPAGRSNNDDRREAEDERILGGEVVMSPRFAETLGVAQASFEEVMKVKQRAVSGDWELKIVAAAVAAAVDQVRSEGEDLIPHIRRFLGGSAAERAIKKASGRDVAAGVRFARVIEKETQAADLDALARTLEIAAGEVPPARGLLAELTDQLDGRADLGRMAAAYLAAEDRDGFQQSVAEAVGQLALSRGLRRVISESSEVHSHEEARPSDYGLAAIRQAGREYVALADMAIQAVPEPRLQDWWDGVFEIMQGLGVPEDAVEDLDERVRHKGRPRAKSLRPDSEVREGWLKAAQEQVQGRIWRGADGRVFAGFGDETAGYVYFSDLAVRPNPTQFPIQEDELRALLSGSLKSLKPEDGGPLEMEATVHRDDLRTVVNRAVALIGDDLSSEGQTLVVGRWAPPGGEPEGQVADVLPDLRSPSRMQTPQTVYLGEGEALERFEAESPLRPGQKADPDEDGTLRVVAFDGNGEHLWFDVPFPGGSKKPWLGDDTEPVAFALDAYGLHDAIDFATERGTYSVLEVAGGVVRVHDPNVKRLTFLPTVTQAQVPERFESVLAAMDVPDAERHSLRLRDVVRRARELQVERVEIEERPERTPQKVAWDKADVAEPGTSVAHEDSPMVSGVYDPVSVKRRVQQAIGEAERAMERIGGELMGQSELWPVSDEVRKKRSKSIKGKKDQYRGRINKLKRKLEELNREVAGALDLDETIVAAQLTRAGQDAVHIVGPEHLRAQAEADAEEQANHDQDERGQFGLGLGARPPRSGR